MDIEGMIVFDLGLQTGTSKAGNPWQKHEYVLETLGQYPRKVKFDVFGDRCNTLTFVQGQRYRVMVDAESREFNGRWYTDLRAYNAQPLEGGPEVPPVGQNPFPTTNAPANQVFGTPAPGASAAAPAPDPFGTNKPDFAAGSQDEDLPF